MSKFYNPYQFIPVTGQVNGDKPRQSFDAIAAGIAGATEDSSSDNPGVRHDLWHKDGLSGRIIARLHLNTPTVVGREQVDGVPGGAKRVKQYEWRDWPAIPASSLKGMLSSLAEALSQSTLRVLNPEMGVPKNRGFMRVQCSRNDSDPECQRYGSRKVKIPHSAHRYFQHIDDDLTPWCHPREKLTPAELLFGVVEVDSKGSSKDAGRNLAGRLRFHDAQGMSKPRTLPEQMLRILDSPKPPSPAMYFHRAGQRGAYLSKRNLYERADDRNIQPNGRKFYLPHPEVDSPPQWQTGEPKSRAKNKLICGPIDQDQELYFHIDFDNLSAAELTLLETTLTPDPGFRHRLGLGKPLGLGEISINVEGVFLVSRSARYSVAALEAPQTRYQRAWSNGPTISPPAWQHRYPAEAEALSTASDTSKPASLVVTSLIDSDTLKVVQTLGNPDNLISLPVRTPITDSQADSGHPEDKTFLWFVDNDEIGGQALGAVNPDGEHKGQRIPLMFSTARDAQQSGRMQDADFEQVDQATLATENPTAAHLMTLIDALVEAKLVADSQQATTSKTLAKKIIDEPEDQQQPLLDQLLLEIRKTMDDDLPPTACLNLFKNAVLNIYRNAGLTLPS